jgi:hypothetical protein
MGNYYAVYTLLWKRGEDAIFRVVDEYTLQSRRRFLFLQQVCIFQQICFNGLLIAIMDDISIISEAHITGESLSQSPNKRSCLTCTALLRALRELQGDDKTFAGESAKLVR